MAASKGFSYNIFDVFTSLLSFENNLYTRLLVTLLLTEQLTWKPLCHIVFGALAALRYGPVDVLVRRLDIARLAVDAAGRTALASQLSSTG